jgi:DNA replication initiation complex subunit (GINS family)
MSMNQNLTAEEQLLYERLGPLFEQERLKLAKALASKADSELFGANEYEVRDRVHELGAKALEVAANERQKKGRVRRS